MTIQQKENMKSAVIGAFIAVSFVTVAVAAVLVSMAVKGLLQG